MWGSLLLLASLVDAAISAPGPDQCPGYNAVNINELEKSLTADLILAGDPCDLYGSDLKNLKLLVEYQTGQCPKAPHSMNDSKKAKSIRRPSSCYDL